MTDVTLGDRTMSLPDLSKLDLPRPDVSLADLPIRELSLPQISLPEIALPDLRRRSARPPMLPMVVVTLTAGLMLGIVVAAIAWSLAPVRQTAQRIRGRFGGPSWTNGPEPEYLENAIAGRPRENDSPMPAESPTKASESTPVAAMRAATPMGAPNAASPNGSTPASRPVSPRSTIAPDPGRS